MPESADEISLVHGKGWVESVVERLTTSARVSDTPGYVTLSEFRLLRQCLAQDVLLRPRLTRAIEGVAGHRHPESRAIIRPGDLVPVQVAKYAKHVLDDGEWDPERTDLQKYLTSLAATVLDEHGDVYQERDGEHWKLTFGRDEPPDGNAEIGIYTVVSFLPVKGLWLTGFRPDRGRSYVSARGAVHQGRWIRVQR
jgi:hypothetical protein